MRKEKFTIHWENGTKEVLGYILEKDGVKVGIDQRKEEINSDKFWYVSELTTGLRLPFRYKTRQEAIFSGFVHNLENIKKALKKD